jgi:D-alanine transaminase
MTIVYLNGKYLPVDRAYISVEDRGFLFGDSLYEVVRCYRGRPFHLDLHLERFYRGIEGARLPRSKALERLPSIIERILEENQVEDTNIYIQYTRGVSHPRSHTFPSQPRPTLLVMPVAIHALPDHARSAGVTAETTEDIRWHRCSIKTTMLLPNILAKQQARDREIFEAVLVRDGFVTEGASTNVFALLDGVLTTHPTDDLILGGITRDVVLSLSRGLGLKSEERAFTVEELYGAGEVMLTSTTIEVLPVTSVDGKAVGDGYPGPVFGQLLVALHKDALGE